MFKKLQNLFTSNIYVKVYKNKLVVKNLDEGNEVILTAVKPFTTERLLIGDFSNAEKLLKEALKNVTKERLLAPSPIILIQPMVMFEGGLAPVEERVLNEVAFGAGGRKVIAWVGKELSNEEAISKIEKT